VLDITSQKWMDYCTRRTTVDVSNAKKLLNGNWFGGHMQSKYAIVRNGALIVEGGGYMVPAGYAIVRKQTGEIIFRTVEGVQVGSTVHLRRERGAHEPVIVGKLIRVVDEIAICSTFAESAEPASNYRTSDERKSSTRRMCNLCQRWFFGDSETCGREECN